MKLRGTRDFYGYDENSFSLIEEKALKILSRFRFKRVRFPIIDYASLFKRTISSSDIVNKELYEFKDKSDREIALVPEGTAPLSRAVSELNLRQGKFSYISPFFRYDRPQKMRYRQFHQIGFEIVGYNDAYSDAEAIILVNEILQSLNISSTLEINFLATDRKDEYLKYLLNELPKQKHCEDCEKRFQKNILRALDCKACKYDVKPSTSFLSDSEAKRYDLIKSILVESNIKFIERNIVRGLDYYTGVVFEFIHEAIALAAGGRYDDLYKQIANNDISAVGAAIGIERLIDLLPKVEVEDEELIVISLTDAARIRGYMIANYLRSMGKSVEFNLEEHNLKKQLSKTKAKYAIIIGNDELHNEKYGFKDLVQREQQNLTLDEIIRRINV